MSDNPLEFSEQREGHIRDRAYQLWQADGGPEGRDTEYWERASDLVRMEENPAAAQLPNPASEPGADPARVQPQPVEEASLQENLGEFPGRFTDQGDRAQTPRAKRG